MPGRALGLVAHEQHVVSLVAEHGLQVVDDAPAGAHAIARDDDCRSGGVHQVLDDPQVVGVVVDRDQLLEG